jgi:hypothetical protein
MHILVFTQVSLAGNNAWHLVLYAVSTRLVTSSKHAMHLAHVVYSAVY